MKKTSKQKPTDDGEQPGRLIYPSFAPEPHHDRLIFSQTGGEAWQSAPCPCPGPETPAQVRTCAFALSCPWQDCRRSSMDFFTKIITKMYHSGFKKNSCHMDTNMSRNIVAYLIILALPYIFQNIFIMSANSWLWSVMKKFYLAQLESDPELVRQCFCGESARKSQNTSKRTRGRQRNVTR